MLSLALPMLLSYYMSYFFQLVCYNLKLDNFACGAVVLAPFLTYPSLRY